MDCLFVEVLYTLTILKIAEHGGAGTYIVYDYMATGLRGMVSATTSKHVGMVKRAVPQNRLVLM